MTEAGKRYLELLEEYVGERKLGMLTPERKAALKMEMDSLWQEMTEEDEIEVDRLRDGADLVRPAVGVAEEHQAPIPAKLFGQDPPRQRKPG